MKPAAAKYRAVMPTMARCGSVEAIWPPMTAPRMMAATVVPSIQPLALTSWSGGRYSVRMPYFAGE